MHVHAERERARPRSSSSEDLQQQSRKQQRDIISNAQAAPPAHTTCSSGPDRALSQAAKHGKSCPKCSELKLTASYTWRKSQVPMGVAGSLTKLALLAQDLGEAEAGVPPAQAQPLPFPIHTTYSADCKYRPIKLLLL